MKFTFITFLLHLFVITANAQAQSSPHSDFLDINNVRALINSNATLFNDSFHRAAFEVPAHSGNHTIFTSAFWMTSESMRNGLPHFTYAHERIGTYGHFKTGPVNVVNQTPDTSQQFQRLWKVNKTDIDAHIRNWNKSNYSTPLSILEWPGNGSPNTAPQLAPFEDLNGNGIYEPQLGDYPLIKGDQAIYTIANNFRLPIDSNRQYVPKLDSNGNYIGVDSLPAHSTRGFNQIEIHLLVYAYQDSLSHVNNTVFVKATLFNRGASSESDLTNFLFSVYTDFDIGINSFNDYVGTDTARNMFYGYNAEDWDTNLDSTKGYKNNIAAQGVVFLDKEIESTMIDPNSNSQGDLYFTHHYRNYQKNKWKNGADLYYGGDGFKTNGGCEDTLKVVKHIFAGDPTLVNDSLQWTELNTCFSNPPVHNSYSDRRMIGTPDLPQSFNHGTSLVFNYAYVFAQDSGGVVASVKALQVAVDSVQSFYDRTRFVGLNETTKQSPRFSIFPNPAADRITLIVNAKTFEATIYNIRGAVISNQITTQEIDISNFTEGIYFIQVKTRDGITTERFIVSR